MRELKFEAGTLLLRVVDAYIQLGGIVTSSGSQCGELQARIRAINAGVAALNRRVMAKHKATWKTNFSCVPR